jgi:GNAT superfamily N-acetyltransferase
VQAAYAPNAAAHLAELEEEPVSVSPHVEAATAADIESLVELRLQQGWQRGSDLLHAIQAWEHGRLLLIRESELNPQALDPQAPIAATSAIAASTVGVIGNVIVREDYRRRGLGRVVMAAALDWLRGEGVRSVLLDATEDGRPLYTKLGFVAVEPSWFAYAPVEAFHRERLRQLARGYQALHVSGAALPTVSALDAAAFGGDRLGFLRLLMGMPHRWLYLVYDAAGTPAGYTLVRALEMPYTGIRIGPWVARDASVAAALLLGVLDEHAPWRRDLAHDGHAAQLFASISGTNPEARALFEKAGGTLVVDDLIMQYDVPESTPAGPPEDAAVRRAVAPHPEWLYGWVAPMVF